MRKLILLLLSILWLNFLISAQNVGIGTTAPLERLSVVSVSGYGISHEQSSIKLSTYIDVSGGYIGTVSNNPFHLYTNNQTAQFTLLQNGNVGIGNTIPQYKLDIGGRMRISTGSVGNIFTSSGLWMEDYRNGNNRIFFGMQDSIRLGIWGEGTPGVGWGFNFNARNGNVGIGQIANTAKLQVGGSTMIGSGNPATGYMLSVNGKIICTEAKVQLVSGWPDYVFTKDYKLLPLNELELQIKNLGHLPGIPSANEIEKNGMELGDMVKKLMQKVEELTLYIIELKKENELLKKD